MTDENNASVEQSSEVDQSIHNNDFGLPLKQAREKSGLSIEDAAHQLLIPVEVIVAIENSQMKDLPTATFAIGYIRSYARILNISADDIIASYNSMNPDSQSHISHSPFVPEEKRDTSNKTLGLILLGVAMLLLFVWLLQSGSNSDSNQAHFIEDMPGFTESSDDSDNDNIQGASDLMTERSFLENESVELIGDIEKDSEIETNIVEKKTNEAPRTTITTVDEIILTAVGESWCEVFDANGDRLFYQLMKEGDEKKLLGKAPFKVFLGDASKIRIEANKKIVDFDHLISANKNTANLIISSDSEALSSSNR